MTAAKRGNRVYARQVSTGFVFPDWLPKKIFTPGPLSGSQSELRKLVL